ncbi:MAG: isoprenylcysteine carboxylmethyltransferase family protein [Methanomicrobiaceae archaeon]|nr:isoprenylcysteine carboxylmethyltransferase family protein [Methanomicrobiaceae archaeon]
MDELVYKLILLILLLVFMAVRGPDISRIKKREKKVIKSGRTDMFLLGLNTLGMMVFPVIYCFSSFFDRYSMNLSDTLRIAGIIIYAASIVLMYIVLKELKGDWSMKLEIGKGHRLVTSGPYRYIRHPMYTAFYLMMAGQFLLVSNWFVGLFGILSFTILCIARIPNEEDMMTEEFGDDYTEYKKRTKKIIPYLI